MDKTIQVNILDRDYPLRTQVDHEALTREIATFVDSRMRSVRNALPERPDLTIAVIAALSIAEELFRQREQPGMPPAALPPSIRTSLDELAAHLDEVLEEA